jgi:hypothetical protein
VRQMLSFAFRWGYCWDGDYSRLSHSHRCYQEQQPLKRLEALQLLCCRSLRGMVREREEGDPPFSKINFLSPMEISSRLRRRTAPEISTPFTLVGFVFERCFK